MVSYNVYKATSSGAYVEGVCLASDEKPVVGIANGSILFAVDASNGETTRYMYDKSAMAWIEADCPCAGGSGSGGSGGSGGGDTMIINGTVNAAGAKLTAIDKTWNEMKAAYDAGKLCILKYEYTFNSPGGAGNAYALTPLDSIGTVGPTYFASFYNLGRLKDADFRANDPDAPMEPELA